MDLERHTRIYKDVLTEISPEDSVLTYDEDDLRVREMLEREVAEIIADGMIPDIPNEWP